MMCWESTHLHVDTWGICVRLSMSRMSEHIPCFEDYSAHSEVSSNLMEKK